MASFVPSSNVNNENVTIPSDGDGGGDGRMSHLRFQKKKKQIKLNAFVASMWAATVSSVLNSLALQINAHTSREAQRSFYSVFLWFLYVRRAYLVRRMSTDQAHINTKRNRNHMLIRAIVCGAWRMAVFVARCRICTCSCFHEMFTPMHRNNIQKINVRFVYDEYPSPFGGAARCHVFCGFNCTRSRARALPIVTATNHFSGSKLLYEFFSSFSYFYCVFFLGAIFN